MKTPITEIEFKAILKEAYEEGKKERDLNSQIDLLLENGTKFCPERPSFESWYDAIMLKEETDKKIKSFLSAHENGVKSKLPSQEWKQIPTGETKDFDTILGKYYTRDCKGFDLIMNAFKEWESQFSPSKEEKETAIAFAEWIQKGMWHRFGTGESLDHIHPNHRGDDRYRFNGLWYNTTNIIEMEKPLVTIELYDLFTKETTK